VKATFDGTWVRLGPDGRTLYDQSGYGRPVDGGLRLAPEEALYLIHRGRIEVAGHHFDRLLSLFCERPNQIRSFLVYRDIRERGYAVQTGPHDFRVFRRGERPGTGQSQYLVRVISERDLVGFPLLLQEAATSSKMRKQHILAVVDDENELTYYEAKVQPLPAMAPAPSCPLFDAFLAGRNAVARLLPGGPEIPGSFGMRLDPGRLLLSPLETLYLIQTGCLRLQGPEGLVGEEEYFAIASGADVEMTEKAAVYADLRMHGYVPRTGYKFGHHFRVYTGQKVHSDLLVHAVAGNASLPMSTISRSVRLSHSVKKKMLFGCVHSTGIHYLEFARVKL
jgi:tRNA-intron endonuclease